MKFFEEHLPMIMIGSAIIAFVAVLIVLLVDEPVCPECCAVIEYFDKTCPSCGHNMNNDTDIWFLPWFLFR